MELDPEGNEVWYFDVFRRELGLGRRRLMFLVMWRYFRNGRIIRIVATTASRMERRA
jgi:hypothetical protein